MEVDARAASAPEVALELDEMMLLARLDDPFDFPPNDVNGFKERENKLDLVLVDEVVACSSAVSCACSGCVDADPVLENLEMAKLDLLESGGVSVAVSDLSKPRDKSNPSSSCSRALGSTTDE